jgi:DNA-binding transcriptional LysR family regulator
MQRYPNIELDIVTDDALVDIVSSGFDAGIRLGEKLHQDMVAVRLSGDLEMKVVACRTTWRKRRSRESRRICCSTPV